MEGLMGPGIDPHGYQASAPDVDKMFQADIVAYNGLELEGQMRRVFSELGKMDKEVFVLEQAGDQAAVLDSDEEDLNRDPHIWFSVPLWAEATDYIANSLSDFNSKNASYYTENNKKYQKELKELDDYIRTRTEEVPKQSRYLITAHDAFKYFGEEYGFEVIGLQGLNTQTESGTRDVSNLAQFHYNGHYYYFGTGVCWGNLDECFTYGTCCCDASVDESIGSDGCLRGNFRDGLRCNRDINQLDVRANLNRSYNRNCP